MPFGKSYGKFLFYELPKAYMYMENVNDILEE